MSKLAIKIWEKHIENFCHFDLVNKNGNSLDDETKSVSLFSTIITLEEMLLIPISKELEYEIVQAKIYLYGSKYYAESNSNSKY
jgi:hypothetical protein